MNLTEIAKKWQEVWEKERIFEADPNGSEKFFLTAAFPYPNSPQHIGHARTYTITDIYARFKRMRGYNVLFPMAFHVTGTPIMAMAKRIEEKDEELLKIMTDIYGFKREEVLKLTDPRDLVMFFSKETEAGMKEMGFSIDWRRKFYTFDPEFNSFIVWQFHKLKEMGLLTKGKHPVPYCTKCHNVVGAHDTKGDVDPELGEFVLILFPFEDGYLPAATLRPETVYGVTNMWINPEATYVKAKVDDRILYISKEAALKMELQDHRVEILEEFKGDRIVGKACRHPLEDKEVPILKGLFVDPANATGVVMSVPSHAPYDYAALRDEWGERADEALVDVIEVEGGPHPAKRIVEEMGIKDQRDPKLEEATKTLYRRELRHGRMITGEFKGLPVEEAREKVKEKLLSMGKGLLMQEILNRPVKCRCGGTVEVKIVEDQWFIDYGNPEWKEKARECLRNMRIIPESRRKDYEYAIEWLHEKACTRASGLGTKFPFDETKMIEALSDSTVYMAFYTIRHKLKRPLSVEEWDYVLLGKGEGKDELKELREHFDYWYPLDSRHSGADLIYNHLPFFIFNHSAIFPKEKWPKQIVTNGFVLMNGQKMSKSLGNILPLRKAIRMYGPDPVRIAVAGGADLDEDTDFNETMIQGIISRLRFFLEVADKYREGEEQEIDRWLWSRFLEYTQGILDRYDNLEVRAIVNDLLYRFHNDVKWYLRRGGQNLGPILRRWVLFFGPVAPHFAEEMWHLLGGDGLVSQARMEEIEAERDLVAEEKERIVMDLLKDGQEVLRLLERKGQKGRKVYIICADEFKREVFRRMGDAAHIGEAMKRIGDVEDKKRAAEIVKMGIKWKREIVLSTDDEKEYLRDAKEFLSKEWGLEVDVLTEDEVDESMRERARRALPGKPSLFVVSE